MPVELIEEKQLEETVVTLQLYKIMLQENNQSFMIVKGLLIKTFMTSMMCKKSII